MMKKSIEISLEKAREIYTQKNEAMNALLLEEFTKEELENIEPEKFEDIGEISGWWVSNSSRIKHAVSVNPVCDNRNLWAREEQAEACRAMSELSQWMKLVNGDWVPDWEDQYFKYGICFVYNKPIIFNFFNQSQFLAFKTAEIRDKFLKKHEQLIITARPLL